MKFRDRAMILLAIWSLVCVTVPWSTTALSAADSLSSGPLDWPEINREQKPWTRWWWFGSVVDPENLEAELQRLSAAGLGGIELTCIAGAKGYEEQYIPYLSPRWVEMLNTTTSLADGLDLGVDLPPCSGWIYGGSWVTPEQTLVHAKLETHPVAKGSSCQIDLADKRVVAITAYSKTGQFMDLGPLPEKTTQFSWQAPPGQWTVYVLSAEAAHQDHRAVAPGGEGLPIDPFSHTSVQEYLAGFAERTKNLRKRGIRAYYHDSFEYFTDFSVDLLDEFSRRRGYDLRQHLPALFGNVNADPSLRIDSVARVRCDYRETISDMHLEHFVDQLTKWSHERGSRSRNQAHGAPGNLLDLYAAADMPEAEMYGRLDNPGPPMHPFTDSMSVKLASSAGHVAGRKLIASECFTWLDRHFHTTLDQMKTAIDRFLVGGANHIFYHGTAYTPDYVPWPGWLYYASTQVNPRNTIWGDLPTLNQYVARCQAVLQAGEPGNDILLYWPIHDLWQVGHDIWWQDYTSYFRRRRYEQPELPLLDGNWSTIGYMQLTLHSKNKWLDPEPVGRVADRLWRRGYGFDFVSDALLDTCVMKRGNIRSPGAQYRIVLVPAARVMPLDTLEKLLQLAHDGGTVAFVAHLPEDVPGLNDVNARQARLRELLTNLRWSPTDSNEVREAKVGRGRVLLGQNLESLLPVANVQRESMLDHPGLQFIRRRHPDGHDYFVTNEGSQPLNGWVMPACDFSSAVLLDPMTGKAGIAECRQSTNESRQVRLQLEPGQSLIMRTLSQPPQGASWKYRTLAGKPIEIRGKWTVDFIEGGPSLPNSFTTESLESWTKLGDEKAISFAGTARYSISFDSVGQAKTYLLDLGLVGDSARVILNDQPVAVLVSRPFHVPVDNLRPTGNLLQIEVTNVAANRVRDLDIRQVPWKEIHGYGMLNMGGQVNKAGLKSRNLDASLWDIREAGLFGPVTLQPLD